MSTLVSRPEVRDRETLNVNVNYDNDPVTIEIRRGSKTVLLDTLTGDPADPTQMAVGSLLAMLVRLDYDLDYTEFP